MTKLRALFFVLLMGINCTISAQVYKSTDADGNTVFSDTPTAGSQAIQIPQTNVGDPVKLPEPAPVTEPESEPRVAVEEAPPEIEGDMDGIDYDDSRNLKRRLRPRPTLYKR